MKSAERDKKLLLGMGLDSDGEARLTTGDNFFLVGGTEDTHEKMQEKAIKFNEKLKERGRTLDEIGSKEAREIAGELDITLL